MSDHAIQGERGKTIGALTLLTVATLYSIVMAGLYIFVFGGMTGVSPEGETRTWAPNTFQIVMNLTFVFWSVVAAIGLWNRSLLLVWIAVSLFTLEAIILVFSLGLLYLPAAPILIIGAILGANSRKSPVPIDLPSA